jgi:hypothetical protein
MRNVFGGPLPSLAVMGFCRDCGKVLVDACRPTRSGYADFAFKSLCGKCYPWPVEERIDHAAWVKARRGG